MTVYLLTNHLGDVATTATAASFTSTGYDAYDAISGPRSTLMRNDIAATHTYRYAGVSQAVTHVVLARADFFKNALNAASVEVQYGGSWTADSTATAGSMTLLGPRSQDWVKTISRTDSNFGLQFNSNSPYNAVQYSKIYFSNGFDFGSGPEQQGYTEPIDEGSNSYVRQFFGEGFFETEAYIVLEWRNITSAKIEAFEALPIFWPFFIYDDSADLWQHKLEHVIIAQGEPYKKVRLGQDLFSITITFRRLRHYD